MLAKNLWDALKLWRRNSKPLSRLCNSSRLLSFRRWLRQDRPAKRRSRRAARLRRERGQGVHNKLEAFGGDSASEDRGEAGDRALQLVSSHVTSEVPQQGV